VVRHDLKDMQFQPPTPHVTFERIAVRRVSFRDSDFFFLGVFGCIFEDCDFTGACISAGQLSHFPPSIFRRCRFHGLDLRTVSPFTARFEECSFSNSDLRDEDQWLRSVAVLKLITAAGHGRAPK
jgi:uncharacterized protein YjbI with pentapeptide repeats